MFPVASKIPDILPPTVLFLVISLVNTTFLSTLSISIVIRQVVGRELVKTERETVHVKIFSVFSLFYFECNIKLYPRVPRTLFPPSPTLALLAHCCYFIVHVPAKHLILKRPF